MTLEANGVIGPSRGDELGRWPQLFSASEWQITRRAVGWPRVEVAAGGGHRRVAEGGLDEVDGRTALEGVRGVRAPEWW
jgi:hypothetical protein